MPVPRLRPWVLLAAVLLCLALGMPRASAADPSPIQTAWQATGGASGPLGAATSAETCGLRYGGCSQRFTHGTYYWSSSTGAHHVLDGVLADDWSRRGGLDGSLAYPVEDSPVCAVGSRCRQHFQNGYETWTATHGVHPVDDRLDGSKSFGLRWVAPLDAQLGYPVDDATCTLPRGGCTQEFEHGALYYVPDYSSAWAVLDGAIRDVWTAQGGVGSWVGYPFGDQLCGRSGVCAQQFGSDFPRTVITWSSRSGAHHLSSTEVTSRWQRGGVDGALGAATGPERAVAGGFEQDFEHGSIFGGDGLSAREVRYALWDEWTAWGRLTGMGRPLADERCSLEGDGCLQDFASGAIYWSPLTGAKAVRYAFAGEYERQGEQDGRLGYPVRSEGCGKRNGGCSQEFQGGTELWSGATGATTVYGALRSAYAAQGWENGRLGYPLGNEQCGGRDGGCVQELQGGTLLWSPGTGAHSVLGALRDRYRALGAETGDLGYPVTDEACGKRDGGCSQEFQGGTLLWSPVAGAHAVYFLIRDEYRQRGWENGRLGYPVAEKSCSGPDSGCRQTFQDGIVAWSSSTGTHVVLGAIGRAYDPRTLGYPVTNEACGKRDGGCSQEFQGGTVLWSPATGAHPVTGGVRTTYRAQGWENGGYGYPVSDPVPAGSGRTSQRFQGGTITG
ncbi:hypothetical protein [Modestobacter sp. NPDC049651]|uniref:hypothetical protein n=1 Tax=unclassified Modestobacter TaxID=2643866 RepID=UPI0033F81E7F